MAEGPAAGPDTLRRDVQSKGSDQTIIAGAKRGLPWLAKPENENCARIVEFGQLWAGTSPAALASTVRHERDLVYGPRFYDGRRAGLGRAARRRLAQVELFDHKLAAILPACQVPEKLKARTPEAPRKRLIARSCKRDAMSERASLRLSHSLG